MAKKSFGQHFLQEAAVIDKIIHAIDVDLASMIVEVGPGKGALAKPLSRLAKKLVLIEADKDLLQSLRKMFPLAKLIQADAAKIAIDDIVQNQPWIFVSNLPYNAANAILMNMLRAKNAPKQSVIMVQKEVGQKILAHPGDLSVLSVAVQMYTKPKRICVVRPGSFSPAPSVDSMVLALESKDVHPKAEQIIALAKAGFSSRRKQLHRTIDHSGMASSEQVKSALVQMGKDPKIRAQELCVSDWEQLFFLLS